MSMLDEEERILREHLEMLQDMYARAAKPTINRLVEIMSIKTPSLLVSSDVHNEQIRLIASNWGKDDHHRH